MMDAWKDVCLKGGTADSVHHVAYARHIVMCFFMWK